MKNEKHILVIDDDERIRKLLQRFLRENNYIVSTASNSDSAKKLISIISFDLLILDVMMPGEDGLSLTKKLLKEITTPIILLTARKEIADRIIGLESGADDYIAKPFEPRELILRIESILKRMKFYSQKNISPKITKIGDLKYDNIRNELWKGENIISLTTAERLLMKELVRSANKPIHRRVLAQKIFKGTNTNQRFSFEQDKSLIPLQRERGVDVNVNRLRKKIEQNPKYPRYLKTVRGVGYILVPD